jgi:hypothetical protein
LAEIVGGRWGWGCLRPIGGEDLGIALEPTPSCGEKPCGSVLAEARRPFGVLRRRRGVRAMSPGCDGARGDTAGAPAEITSRRGCRERCDEGGDLVANSDCMRYLRGS